MDGWSVSGTCNPDILSTILQTGGVQNDFASIALYDTALNNLLNFSKDLFFQTTVIFPSTEYNDAFFGFGYFENPLSLDNFGFKMEDGALKAYWTKNSTPYTYTITGIDITQRNVYRAFTDVDKQEIYFYINGELKYTATSNFPVGTSPYIFSYYLVTNTDEAHHMFMCDLYLEIER